MSSVDLTCPNCGNVFSVRYKDRDRKFCGHGCAASFHNRRLGVPPALIAASRARADRIRGTGTSKYVKRGGRHEHRVVAEQTLGRALLPGEIVHHEDEDGHNNAPHNLGVLPNQAEHARLHHAGKKRTPRNVCKFGHPLVGDNVNITSIGRRRCLICMRAYNRNWRKSQRERAQAQ